MNKKEEKSLTDSISKLDIEQARIKHVLFKSKLRALLYGADIDPEPVLLTSHCSLGKWINEVAIPGIGHLPEVQELERVHNDMHTIARRLWDIYQSGQQDQALSQLNQIDATAQKLLQLLDSLQNKMP